ncbi:hypothetical protein KY362_03260 [Candidatus Woesearchaeota archaeon]|nr:hypothetical protein [Candidatus Woesearchaeota archaeon]
MKHSLQVTLILVAVFLIAQFVGLGITSQALPIKTVDAETGEEVILEQAPAPGIERPKFDEERSWELLVFLGLAILIGTGLVLLLARFKAFRTWKVWFLFAVTLCLYISFYTIIRKIAGTNLISMSIALAIGIALGYLKIFRPNVIIHNVTEVFVYAGLAVIFVPISAFTVKIAIGLLLLISIYDMIAVWQSKHMVKMAKFQSEAKMFAGLSIPYSMPKKGEKVDEVKPVKPVKAVKAASAPVKAMKKGKEKQVEKHIPHEGKTAGLKTAILGGGDIGFPLLFAGVLMKEVGFLNVLFVPVAAAIALFLLLYFAKKDRFYPAMPFISAGCFVGYGLVLLI